MRTLTTADIVRVWEQGLRQPRWRAGGLALAPVLPELTQQALLSLPLGERNEYLFAVHRRLFGDIINLVVRCPACAQDLEFFVDVTVLCPDGARAPRSATIIEHDDWRIVVRPLCTADLGSIVRAPSLAVAVDALRRCAVLEAERDGVRVHRDDVPDTVYHEIAERMPDVDPHSEIRLALQCPDCGAEWISLLDIGAIVWDEIAAHARNVLEEVHALATAYGWSEPEILALSPQRRRSYLDMVR